MLQGKKHIVLFIGMLVLVWQSTQGQDLYFSQYYNAPLLTNPANTGFMPEYDYRAGINYRNQYGVNLSNPYKTMSAWGDAQLLNNKWENAWLGLGASLLNDVAGSGQLKSTKAYANIAYHQLLSNDVVLSGGLGFGVVQKTIDASKFLFNSQWNGRFFDVNIPAGEAFATNNVWYADINAGLNIAWFASENSYINTGVSLMHINNPKEQFLATNTNNAVVPKRLNAFINGSFKLNNEWLLNPNIYYSRMANNSEVMLGSRLFNNLSGDGSQQLILGAYYRLGDALVPTAGMQLGNLQLAISYDATVSNATAYNATRGAYELSVCFNGIYSNANKKALQNLRCPSPKF